jgi:hypothetical protein
MMTKAEAHQSAKSLASAFRWHVVYVVYSAAQGWTTTTDPGSGWDQIAGYYDYDNQQWHPYVAP